MNVVVQGFDLVDSCCVHCSRDEEEERSGDGDDIEIHGEGVWIRGF